MQIVLLKGGRPLNYKFLHEAHGTRRKAQGMEIRKLVKSFESLNSLIRELGN